MRKRYKKLRGAMAEHDITQEILARHLLIGRRTMSAKFTATSPWNISEMYAAMDLMNLPHDQMHIYFPPGGISPEKGGETACTS